MAIVKKTFDMSSNNAYQNDIYQYFVDNCVPEYFDEIVLEGNYIKCIKNDIEVFTLVNPNITSYYSITLKINNGVTDQSCSTPVLQYAYKCKNGISFSESFNGRHFLTLCKDNNNETTFVFCNNSQSSSHPISIGVPMPISSPSLHMTPYGIKVICINVKSPSITFNALFFANTQEIKSVLCPLLVSRTENYTTDVSLLVYTQDVNQNVIDIDGVKYLSNGLWVVKDE